MTTWFSVAKTNFLSGQSWDTKQCICHQLCFGASGVHRKPGQAALSCLDSFEFEARLDKCP
jgi:hypothetical protein